MGAGQCVDYQIKKQYMWAFVQCCRNVCSEVLFLPQYLLKSVMLPQYLFCLNICSKVLCCRGRWHGRQGWWQRILRNDWGTAIRRALQFFFYKYENSLPNIWQLWEAIFYLRRMGPNDWGSIANFLVIICTTQKHYYSIINYISIINYHFSRKNMIKVNNFRLLQLCRNSTAKVGR